MAARTRKQVRGKQLVANVMSATIAEMARVGTERLSIEEVAARAAVNKTTIYRRWPTPQVLAREALMTASEASACGPDTGSLRGDLAELAREFRRVTTSPDMQTLIRMRFAGPTRGSFATLMSELQEKKHERSKTILRRAVTRGELPRGTDIELLHDVVVGALLYLVVFANKRSDATRLERAVHVILDGAMAVRTSRRPRARRSETH
jgi:AcrR family transcriptional regulator